MQKIYQHLKEQEPYWPNNSIYFLTDSTFLHFPYFNNDAKKQIVLNQIIKINKKLGIPISDYSIAINHYHLKFYLQNGLNLSKIKQLLRGGISYEFRKRYNVPYKDMWQTRKLVVVFSEKANWRITGYIIGNLLKHKEVSTFRDLRNNKFSSYWYIADKYGEKVAKELVYGVIDIDESADNELNMEELNDVSV
ncbi:MAG: transposase [Patescibacteria group bacterium]